MENDLHSFVKIVPAVPPAVFTATVTGTTIDTLGFESLEYAFHIGTALTGAGAIIDVTLEQAPDVAGSPGAWAAVPAAEILGTLPQMIEADANKCFRVGSIGKERFQRCVMTETVAVTGGVVGAVGILSNPKSAPVAAQFT